MAQARFSIGIDLGTSNSALAFVRLSGDSVSEVFAVPQWDSLSGLTDSPILPSFLYLPEDAVAEQILGRKAGTAEWIVGRLARKRAAETPGRVAHSAKSWLCHHAADRSAPFLPWGSEEIPHQSKLSPICASALILDYLRGTWNSRFAGSDSESRFDAQDITVTVPASFDAAAQRLTLAAAQEAGFPATVRLLEEPQAAFYSWLEQHDPGKELWNRLPTPDAGTHHVHHVLVVDVGGGTSDFSLFELRPKSGRSGAEIKRVAVSDHILLGGDNIDLAIAHLLEPRLGLGAGKLSGAQWDHLVARCRDLKEKALSSAGAPDEAFPVSVPGRGSSLVAGSLSAQLTRAEIENVILEGFFPECDANDRPRRTHTALKEWGLPYASDSAVTRHLADFLKGRPRVDAVLANGGSLYPQSLRERICQQIGKWQASPPPLVLENAEPDLAVARGAARFGKVVRGKAKRIEAGAPRAVFLEAHRKRSRDAEADAGCSLVCILPQDAAPEETFDIADLALELRVNRPVRFQTYSSTRHGKSRAGDVVDWSEADFHALPPLETVAKVADSPRGEPGRTLPVTLTAKLNELGLLQVSCRSADQDIRQSWPLDFDLRPHEQRDRGALGPAATLAGPVQAEPNVVPAALEAARQRIGSLFTQPLSKRDKLTAARLVQSLEKTLGLPKGDWNWVLVRALWSSLEACIACRKHSVEHEETWLILAGFLLRPGFGAAMDEVRIDSLWRIRDAGLYFPGKRIKLQEYILWRRVAGGLSRERQEAVLAAEFDKIRQQKDPPGELIRLAGSLERVGLDAKAELTERFIHKALNLTRERKHSAPYLTALGLLLNRAPLYAGPETVVSPDLVEQAYEAFRPLDWADPELSELQILFLRAARVVDNHKLDLPRPLRDRIASRLEKCGVAPLKTARLREFSPLERSERIGLYGESLPPGLILSEN
jgi:molecular chaperone DnaK (HSP70)